MFAALRAALLVVLGLGYLVPALHFTLVQHEVCAEHGELHHGDASALHAAERSARVRDASLEAAPRVEHEHEHCAVLATSSARATTVSSSAVDLAPAPECAVSALSPAARAHSSLDVLLYAPKLAPPS